MQHLVSTVRLLRPDRFAVSRLGLERQAGPTRRVAHQDPLRFAERDFPAEESSIELGHDVRVGAVDADGLEAKRWGRDARQIARSSVRRRVPIGSYALGV